ncbi:AraC family transcriptional regulator, partial [Xanthomonas sp. Kuri4-2]
MTASPSLVRYAEAAAPPALRDRLRCGWRFRQGDAPETVEVLPDGCVDLIWDGSRLFVA